MRSLPCKPLASASAEHSFDLAFLASVVAGAEVDAAGAGVAGAGGVCAKAKDAALKEKIIAEATKEVIFISKPFNIEDKAICLTRLYDKSNGRLAETNRV